MADWTSRTELILGKDGLSRLQNARVVVVGLGGVGAAASEMLVRSGVGTLILIDSDTVGESNINRQLIALHSTIGRPKTDVLASRLLDINPDVSIIVVSEYVNEDNIAHILGCPGQIDYVVDAIDTLSPKIALIQYCLANGIRLVSSMGSGAKLDATRVRVADISETRQCPLAHMLRKRLHKLGITSGFQAVFSEEKPMRTSVIIEESRNKKSQVGSISYLPAVFGCICAQTVIRAIADV